MKSNLARGAVLATATAALFVSPIPSASAHDGGTAHADMAYTGDKLTFDKDSDVGSGWNFNQRADSIDANFWGMNVITGECENTTGPCMNVQEVCFDGQSWWFDWDRQYFGNNPQHGRLRLNRCAGSPDVGRDEAASCRSIMKVLGSHAWSSEDNNTCMDVPWRIEPKHPNAFDLSQLNLAYGVV